MSDKAIRDLLSKALAWHDAHATFDDAVADVPEEARGLRPANLPYSAWELLEHLRITQHDILDFCVNPGYREMTWPDGYWPSSPKPPSAAAWDGSVRAFREDRKALQKLAELLANVLPLVPLASPELRAGDQVVAQLPIRVSSRASGPFAVGAKLARGGRSPQSIESPAPDLKAFAAPAGAVYTIALPANLDAGEYRLIVETTLGREKASREITFRVVRG
jgi:hypothetical protein